MIGGSNSMCPSSYGVAMASIDCWLLGPFCVSSSSHIIQFHFRKVADHLTFEL